MSARRIPVLAAAIALLACVGVARATTGGLEIIQPKVIVPIEDAAAYEGRYVLDEVGRGANVRSGEMKIELRGSSTQKFLSGAIQLYEYNAGGHVEIGLFDLYPFRPDPRGAAASIQGKGLARNGGASLGDLVLDSPSDGAKLEGEIELHGTGPYPVVFSRLPEGQSTAGSPQPAKQLDETGSAAEATGWGADPAEYEGEYELTDAAPDTSADAGILGPVIAVAQGLGAGGVAVTGGSMTVSGGESPSAEVTLELGGSTQTFFLGDLAWQGDRRVADVHQDSPTGQEVGRFAGTQSADVIQGTLEAGGASYGVSFQHQG